MEAAKLSLENRTLYHGDNLPFLRGMNSETVHLIATDPPFNKSRDFHATPDSLAKGARFQDRWSWRDDIHDDWLLGILRDYPEVWSVIDTAKRVYGDDMGAFLCFMAVRLLEMHRVRRACGLRRVRTGARIAFHGDRPHQPAFSGRRERHHQPHPAVLALQSAQVGRVHASRIDARQQQGGLDS